MDSNNSNNSDSSDTKKLKEILEIIDRFGGFDGEHHKQYVLDQIVRIACGCPSEKCSAKDCNGLPYSYNRLAENKEYNEWVKNHRDGVDGPETYDWDVGIPP